MTQVVAIQEWLGRSTEPLAPETIQFTTRPAKSCRGCLFDDQHSSICERACQVAQRSDLEHCERGFIYVAKPVDARQLTMIEKGH